MVWFRVDDNLAFHRKALKAGNAAMGLWVRAGSQCSSQLTDGHVSAEMAALLGADSLAQKLVGAGLWLPDDDGYVFHQWSLRNPTKAQVEAERKAAAERKERWKQRRENGGGTP